MVDAGGPYTGDEGSAIPLNTATATDPDAGDAPTYKWTYVANGAVDAGTTCSFSNDAIVQPTFTCNDDGSFTLTLTVNDGHGHIVQDNAGVTVEQRQAHRHRGRPLHGRRGLRHPARGTGDDPAANDDDPKLTYKWTVNTAGIDAGGACTFDDDTKKNAKVTCTDDGAFTVTLVVEGRRRRHQDASTADLTVTNVKPVANARRAPILGRRGLGHPARRLGERSGRQRRRHLTYKWTANTTGIDAGGSCTFDDDTKKDAKVTCTDDSNGTSKSTWSPPMTTAPAAPPATANLTVANVKPVAHAGGPY